MGQASLMDQVLPQDDDQRIRMPDLPPAGGMGVNYGYTPNGMAMPSSMGMPNLNLQAPEFGIVDPTYLAQLAILNQGGGSYMPANAPAAPMGMLGAGLESQDQFRANAPLLGGAPMIADRRAYSPNRSANGLLNQMIANDRSSGEFGMEPSAWSQMSPAAQAAYYNQNPTMAAITQFGQKVFGYAFPGIAAAQQYLAPDFVRDQEMIAMGLNPNQNFEVNGKASGFNYGDDYDSFASDRQSAGMGGAYEGSAGSTAATADMPDGPDGANASSKIVCTAMNEAYGFGSFRNKIWLAYAAKNLTKAHEAGYHALFLPLVSAGYRQDKWYSKPLRAVLENIARHRSADLRAEMRGTKRDRVGQAYRFILEPLCYAVGKLKGN
jgi:hypothetical protein